MNGLEGDLARYYDQDAAARAGRAIEPERALRRDRFAELLAREQRTQVVEVGVGTGADARALQAHGLTVTGVDLSPENVALCRSAGVPAHVGSALDLPFPDQSFDAAFSMSTFMHLPDRAFVRALEELGRVLVSGAPAALGLWGGDDTEGEHVADTIEPHRYFSWRSAERVHSLLTPHAEIAAHETWRVGDDPPRPYQWYLLRFTGPGRL